MYFVAVICCALTVIGITIFPLFASYVVSKHKKKAVVFSYLKDYVSESEFEAKWVSWTKISITVGQVSGFVFCAVVLYSLLST
jgi:hypothetical protein